MTNGQRRRMLKEAEREARSADTSLMQQTQERAVQARIRVPKPTRSATGCQKRRRRKHRSQGVKLMQSKRGYLRPYYPHEFEAIKRGER